MQTLTPAASLIFWVVTLASVASLGVLVFLFLLGVVRHRVAPRAANWFLLGVGLVLASRLGGWFGSMLLARTATPGGALEAQVVVQLLGTALSCAGWSCFLVAAFVDRGGAESSNGGPPIRYSGGAAPADDGNPYRSS